MFLLLATMVMPQMEVFYWFNLFMFFIFIFMLKFILSYYIKK